jgi:hypothetical protein
MRRRAAGASRRGQGQAAGELVIGPARPTQDLHLFALSAYDRDMGNMRSAVVVFLALLGVSACQSDEGRCEDICATIDSCDGIDLDVDNCISECTSDAEEAGERCSESFDYFADCVSDEDLDCDSIIDEDGGTCTAEANDFGEDCEVDFRDMFEEIEGSDSCGAGNDSCIYAYDGYCQEGSQCAAGTDNYDCFCF